MVFAIYIFKMVIYFILVELTCGQNISCIFISVYVHVLPHNSWSRKQRRNERSLHTSPSEILAHNFRGHNTSSEMAKI